MATFLYLLCLVAMIPLVLFAIYVVVISTIADQQTLGNILTAMWEVFMDLGFNPARYLAGIVALPFCSMLLLVLGFLPKTRPYGFLAIAAIGVIGFASIYIRGAGPRSPGEFLYFAPSLLATVASGFVATRLLVGKGIGPG